MKRPIRHKLRKVLFIPDVHRPYHDKRAWALMLKAMRSWGPDFIVLLGDYLDGYKLSRFTQDPKRYDWEAEVSDGNTGLDELDALDPYGKIYIGGNHDGQRYDDYIKRNAPQLCGIKSLSEALDLKRRGWHYVPYRDHYKLGKVYLTHDVNATGRNAVHKIIDVYQHSAITGHTHRITYAVEADGLGEPILSATFGWLGDLSKVDYQHRIIATKAYVLGFGVGYLDQDGILFANPVPIVKYRCLVEGKVYQG